MRRAYLNHHNRRCSDSPAQTRRRAPCPLHELSSKALFFALALPAVLRASLRLTWLNRHYDLDQLADRLRQVRPWGASYLANPRYLRGTSQRLLYWLPPRGFGPCLKHSFLLLDLWSRCGLEPTIHIGTLKEDGEHHFHAWVSLPETAEPTQASTAEYAELWSH